MFAWLDRRTGFRRLLSELLFENIPGGSRWRYVWGSTLAFTFFVQVATGILLWTAYSPSSQTAWESVYFIQHEMQLGWLLRGIHHYAAHAMILLLALHFLQVVIDGAYRAPREVNFWFGIALLLVVLGLSLTGYLLPWDQKGYWATKVTTSLMASVPWIGPSLESLVVGGDEYGHHTLTRFFALHAGLLPLLLVLLTAGHVYLFRYHGLTPRKPIRRPDSHFWPDQVFKDAVVCLAVFAAILLCVIWPRLTGDGSLGASLGAPANPAEDFPAARPEWYFLFLFQLLKYFPGELEIVGTLVIPGGVVLLIALMPFLGRWRLGHYANIAFLSGLILGCATLTLLAVIEDSRNPDYLLAQQKAREEAERVRVLASGQGIPVEGALELLRRDPLSQGPKLFALHCSGCHRYDGHDGTGREVEEAPSAADLHQFASRQWLRDLLSPEHVASERYFGNTAFSEGKMVGFVQRKVAAYGEEERRQLEKAVLALSAEAALPYQAQADQRDQALILEGRTHLDEDLECLDCHTFHFEDQDATAPTLTGYGSHQWLADMISDPAHPRFYGDRNDRMPSFQENLDPEEIGIIARWLRQDWYEPETAGR